MDWVLNNLDNVIIPIIIMVLYGLGSAAQKKDKKAKKQQQRQGGPQQQADPNEARRVREIQEEIRRKIAERTGRTPPPLKKPARAQPVQVPPQSRGQKRPAYEKPHGLPQHSQKYSDEQRGPSTPPIPKPQPVFQTDTYQREIEEKMRQVRELESKARSRPAAVPSTQRSKPKVAAGELRRQLFEDLAHPLGQRKAILVSEILGSPVGIKGPSHWKSNA